MIVKLIMMMMMMIMIRKLMKIILLMITISVLGSKRAFYIKSRSRVSSLGFPYDYKSVMHYGKYHMSKNGKPTILPLDPSVKWLGGRSLSPTDILQANVLYHCFGKLFHLVFY